MTLAKTKLNCKFFSRFLAAPVLIVALGLWTASAQVAGGGGAGGGASASGPSISAAPSSPGLANGSAGESANGQNGQGAAGARQGQQATQRNEQQNQTRNEVPAGSQDRPTEFQQMVETTTGRAVPIFGASLFSRETPTTFAPVETVPVGNSYVLGPGDEVTLQLAGEINDTLNLTVDRNGAILIPGLGPVTVAGMTYGELTPYLNHQLNRLYRNFTLTASLGRLRTIQVFVVGEARQPGSYSISSLSTLLNAIFACGGPSQTGSVRDIQVRRGGKVIDHFDLYDLLLHGDKAHDIPLQSGDVIFFPFVGPQVAVVGSVDVQAIYELKGETSVAQGLRLAGGETPVAAGGSIRLDRIYDHKDREISDVTAALSNQVLLQDGDIISVTSIIDRFQNAVTLRGNVANPGRYVWHPGMHLSDLFPNKESLITRNYWRQRARLGQLQQDYVPEQNGEQNAGQPEQTEGALQLKGNAIDRNSENVQAKGSANGDAGGNSVGAALTTSNSVFQAKTDVVLSAPDIDWSYAVIERQSTKDLTTSLIPFNLGSIVLDHNPAENYALLPGDVVTIFSKADLRVPSTQQTRFVRLEGEFVSAGVYSVLPGEGLRDLVRRAGGLTPDAYLYASEFTRESTRRVEQQRLTEYADELQAQISATTSTAVSRSVTPGDQAAAAASAQDAEAAVARLRRLQPIGRIVFNLRPDSHGLDAIPNIALEDGDRFVVPRIPANVTVEGQVYSANAFLYEPNARVVDYLHRAGGPDREADKRRIFVIRADGSVVSRQYANVLHAPIYPGDTIVVPPNLDKRALIQRITDIATIMGNFGFTIAALAILANE